MIDNKQLERWLSYADQSLLTKHELAQLDDEIEREDAFYQNLEFGTGGMRGKIGLGTNRMNIFTVRKAALGLANYLIKSGQDLSKGVVISHDTRRFSREFAYEICRTISTQGITTYLFDRNQPTPVLSYAVRYLQCLAGIMITASHNPPQYNGIKVYGEDGAQLSLEPSEAVIEEVNKVEDELNIQVDSLTSLINKGLVKMISPQLIEDYLKEVTQLVDKVKEDNLTVVFTPLHGCANYLGPKVLENIGLTRVYPVLEQSIEDGNFSTVKSPNPEEKYALAYASVLGKEVGADILLATDPDADRLGVAVLNNEGDYTLLNGNQTGALLLDYICQQTLPEHPFAVKTIVTSELGKKIAESYNVEMFDVLTGFKFIGELIKDYQDTQKIKNYIFGYEESYGYLAGDFARDKDAVQIVALLAKAASDYKLQGMTLLDRLEKLYQQHGYFVEQQFAHTLEGVAGKQRIDEIMSNVRQNPPKNLGGLKVVALEDYANATSINIATDEVTALELPKSNVLKFIFDNDMWACIRPSGTEPKIKVYTSLKSDVVDIEKVGSEIDATIMNY